ncbi:putative membrane protein YccC [Bradyrhizobium japonicum]
MIASYFQDRKMTMSSRYDFPTFASRAWKRIKPGLVHGLTMTASVFLALYIAFELQIDDPSWAGVSAGHTILPALGPSLNKALYRVIGTVIGAAATVVLTAMFPQSRLGFLTGVVVWVSACGFIAVFFKNFRAYAAMLAGYTMAIIASDTVGTPDKVFEVAIARSAAIIIGVLCATLVQGLSDFGSARHKLTDGFAEIVADIQKTFVGWVANPRTGTATKALQSVIKRIAALDTVLDDAVGESSELRQRSAILHQATVAMFGAVSSWCTLEAYLARGSAGEMRATLNAVQIVVAPTPAGCTWADLRDDWAKRAMELGQLPSRDISVRVVADAAGEVALHLSDAANGLVLLTDPARAIASRQQVCQPIAQVGPAFINALRVAASTSAAVLLWIATAWPNGLSAITFAALIPLRMSGRPPQVASGFFFGSILAAVAAAIVQFAVLPNHDSFLALTILAGAVLTIFAAMSQISDSWGIFRPAAVMYLPLLSLSNELSVDTIAFINNAVGILAGCAFGALAFRLLPNIDAATQSLRLRELMWRDLRTLAAHAPDTHSLNRWREVTFARLLALPASATAASFEHIHMIYEVGFYIGQIGRWGKPRQITSITNAIVALIRGEITLARQMLRGLDDTRLFNPTDQAALRTQGAIRGLRQRIEVHAAASIGRGLS